MTLPAEGSRWSINETLTWSGWLRWVCVRGGTVEDAALTWVPLDPEAAARMFDLLQAMPTEAAMRARLRSWDNPPAALAARLRRAEHKKYWAY